MSQEIRDRVRRIYDAMSRGDLEAAFEALEPLDPEVEWVPPAEMPEQGTYHGPQAMKQRIAYLNAETRGESEIEEFIEAGGRTFVGVHLSGRGTQSGAPFEGRLYQVITTLDDGVTIIRVENFFDRARALEVAGLRE